MGPWQSLYNSLHERSVCLLERAKGLASYDFMRYGYEFKYLMISLPLYYVSSSPTLVTCSRPSAPKQS